MKDIPRLLILMLVVGILGHGQPKQTELLQELVHRQQEEHSAVGWVDAGWLDYIVFSDKPIMHKYTLPGPHLWGASLHGPSSQIFGTISPNGKSTFAAAQDGKILWENSDLIVRQPPEISPSGKLLLLEGRDRKTGSEGLLLVEDRGQKVTRVSREGKNPSWSSEDTKFVYEEKGEIMVYDLQSKQKQRIGLGTLPGWSPDGKCITYRTQKDQFVLADASGKVQRTLLDGKRVLTPLYWSPDSEYLMYVGKKAGECNQVVAYRLRDGQSASVFQVCEGYPFWMLRWVRLPSNVPVA